MQRLADSAAAWVFLSFFLPLDFSVLVLFGVGLTILIEVGHSQAVTASRQRIYLDLAHLASQGPLQQDLARRQLAMLEKAGIL